MDKISKLSNLIQKRDIIIKSNIIDAENQIIQIPISSETPVVRNDNGYVYYEVLLHTPEAVDLTRANDGAAVMECHGGEQIGVFDKAFVQEGRVYAQLRFSKNDPETVSIFKDIQDGIVRNFSIDYSINSILPPPYEQIEGYDKITANSWTLLGVSLAPIPADQTVGVGRSLEQITVNPKPIEKDVDPVRVNQSIGVDSVDTSLNQEIRKNKANEPIRKPEINQDTKIQNRRNKMENQNVDIESAIDAESKRRDAIEAIADKFNHVDGVKEFAKKASRSRMTIDEVNTQVLELVSKSNKSETVNLEGQRANTWLPKKDQESYSIARAIGLLAAGKPVDGLEGECAREMESRYGRSTKGNFVIPMDALMKRDNTTVPGSKGGFLVETQPQTFIDLLRNKALTAQLGAQVLPNMVGDLTFPKQTSASNVAYIGETQQVTESELGFGQIVSRPKYARALTQFSKGLLNQSNPSIEALVRNDLVAQAALAIDSSVLAGAGGNAPLGIKNTSGVGSVSTSSATLAKMLDFEKKVATANADFGTMAFLTNPTVRASLKAKDKGTAGVNFIWNDANEVLGYSAYASNQVAANTIYFGNWSQVIVPMWGAGVEIEVLKTSNYTNYGLLDVVLFLAHDVVVKQAGAFAVSTDFS